MWWSEQSTLAKALRWRPNIVSKTLAFERGRVTVNGVMPPQFKLPAQPKPGRRLPRIRARCACGPLATLRRWLDSNRM